MSDKNSLGLLWRHLYGKTKESYPGRVIRNLHEISHQIWKQCKKFPITSPTSSIVKHESYFSKQTTQLYLVGFYIWWIKKKRKKILLYSGLASAALLHSSSFNILKSLHFQWEFYLQEDAVNQIWAVWRQMYLGDAMFWQNSLHKMSFWIWVHKFIQLYFIFWVNYCLFIHVR